METHCGSIAIIGRPNVGKSTLLNAILGKKLSITSKKPQTTRHQIMGIKTEGDTQFIFVDTPGLHQTEKGVLNRYLNRNALQSLREVDVVVWVVDAQTWQSDDDYVAKKLQQISVPLIIAINKTDLLPQYDAVLPLIEKLATQLPHSEIVPISAEKKIHLPRLLEIIRHKLPIAEFYFPATQFTDRSDVFIVTEFIREQLVRTLGQELPYATMVTVDTLQKKDNVLHVHAVIWVAREGQKSIVIGKQGLRLKKISTAARLALERYFNCKIFLQVWVKVKSSWADNENIVRHLLQ